MARKARRKSSRCKYGKLKHPRGRRVCRTRPRRRQSASSRREAIKYVERDLIAKLKSGLGRYRRRRR